MQVEPSYLCPTFGYPISSSTIADSQDKLSSQWPAASDYFSPKNKIAETNEDCYQNLVELNIRSFTLWVEWLCNRKNKFRKIFVVFDITFIMVNNKS